MEFTTTAYGYPVKFQFEQFQDTSYWRVIWLTDDTRDILKKKEDQWTSHTACPSLIKELGSIIDKHLEKGR